MLPEERGDLLYFNYEGGGVTVDGPSLLLRKNVSDSVSLGFNHLIDNVTSASIDVLVTASPYIERRVENSVFADYLRQKTTISAGYSVSNESDYDANTISLGISQDMFGDLTTVSMGFSYGDNEVRQNGDPDFIETAQSRSYRVGMTQVVTKKLVTSLAFENVTDDGYLNNPYRQVRYVDSSTIEGFNFQREVYPGTRTSNAFAVRANYYLDRRASVHTGVRFYNDNWGIESLTLELGYVTPYGENWVLDARFRYYDQPTGAEFYGDLFPFRDAQNYLARDKELSPFTSFSVGGGFSYHLGNRGWTMIERASLNLHVDWMYFDYADFRDLTQGGAVGEEPLYSFDATVIRAFASIWF